MCASIRVSTKGKQEKHIATKVDKTEQNAKPSDNEMQYHTH